MLSDRRVYATIPVANISRARKWYEEKLGLKPRGDEEMALVYETGDGTGFLLYETSFAGQAQNTLASFSSRDVAADVAALRKRGVTFEEYDLPGLKTTDSIAMIGRRAAAWFKDSEGNILAISNTD